jgi:hypothetical protein
MMLPAAICPIKNKTTVPVSKVCGFLGRIVTAPTMVSGLCRFTGDSNKSIGFCPAVRSVEIGAAQLHRPVYPVTFQSYAYGVRSGLFIVPDRSGKEISLFRTSLPDALKLFLTLLLTRHSFYPIGFLIETMICAPRLLAVVYA